MNFDGCTSKWKETSEWFLRQAYDSDWSPASIARKDDQAAKLNDVTNKNSSALEKRPAPSKALAPPKKAKKLTSGFSAFSAFVASHGDVLDESDIDDEPVLVEVTRTSEVDKYLQLPALPTCRHGNDSCPLEWWSLHQHELPHLAKMARQFLALPASSAGVERLFSAAGRLHDDLKKAIKEDTLSMQLEVKVNIPE
jgi:hypothetical protein